MTVFGFHASHEQVDPRQLLADVQSAERAGFGAAMCSDHFAPWSRRQGHSGHAWSWLGAALATTGLRLGVVTAPGQRYHPAIIAQASATLAQMFPGRFWMAPGSGENLNEHITGDPWPEKEERQRRLEEGIDVIRRLHRGETVTHRGRVTVEHARLWDLPPEPVPLIAPAVSRRTTARSAAWADGFITVNQPVETLRELLQAYRGNGGRGPAALQVHLSWAPSQREAERIAMEQWQSNVLPPPRCWDLALPENFEAATAGAGPEDVTGVVNVSADLDRHVRWLAEYAALGFDEVYLHFVGRHQAPFLEAFGAEVLPALSALSTRTERTERTERTAEPAP
ncbi:MAG: TIGR03885 family FMN-dependent LLM class oxidoreductase [Micrococcus sp.]|nr:TIGR03885 family FMN-dependent LLM class oxidoreductase [Micrococcus sp.]